MDQQKDAYCVSGIMLANTSLEITPSKAGKDCRKNLPSQTYKISLGNCIFRPPQDSHCGKMGCHRQVLDHGTDGGHGWLPLGAVWALKT